MKTCFLFPGQGAQYPGMGKDLYEASQKVKNLFELASDRTGIDVKKLLFEGTEEELKSTDKTQIAVTLINLSVAAVLEERGISSDGCAGFSLGEYSALTEAGVIAEEDVFPIVKVRGKIMEKVAKSLDTGSGAPGMAAVIGLDLGQVEDAVTQAGIKDLYPANYNSPNQIVLSGTNDALNKGEEVIKNAGAKRYIRLKVSAPFHSPLMEKAKTELAGVLADYDFKDPVKSVYSNVTAEQIVSGTSARQLCVEQVIEMVRWVDEEKALLAEGYDRCVETGPGKVLTGLWKSVGGDIPCSPAGQTAQIELL